MLISFLIPTRNKIEWLITALESICSTATDRSQFEIIVRIDDDDKERIAAIPMLIERFGVRILTGPRRGGYVSINTFVDEMTAIAEGDWVTLFDDDSFITGNWQDALRELPVEDAANAEFYQLGYSTYPNGPTGGAPGLIVPLKLARSIVPTPMPVDMPWLETVLRAGGIVRQLKGVSWCHEGRARG